MPRNNNGKKQKPNVDSVTLAAEAVMKDGFPVRTAAWHLSISRTTLQRHINFCQKNSSKNTEPKYQYFNRCAVWNVFSKAGVATIRPAGQLRPSATFYPARQLIVKIIKKTINIYNINKLYNI